MSVCNHSFFEKSMQNLGRLDNWMKASNKIDSTIDVIKFNVKNSNIIKLFSSGTSLKDRASAGKGVATTVKNLTKDGRAFDEIVFGGMSAWSLMRDVTTRNVDEMNTYTTVKSKSIKLVDSIKKSYKDFYAIKWLDYHNN